MSRSLSYIFPAGNTTDVCQEQSVGGAAPLVLNGNLVDSITNQVSFISKGYVRSISITSGNNLSGVNFTISGLQNGIAVSEVVAGPNATTVYGAEAYDVITSVTTSAAAADVSIGSGWKGFFPLIAINLERDVINYTLTIARLSNASVSFSVYGTLINLTEQGTYLSKLTSSNLFQIAPPGTNPNFSYTGLTGTWAYMLVQLGASAATIANSMQLNFIQT